MLLTVSQQGAIVNTPSSTSNRDATYSRGMDDNSTWKTLAARLKEAARTYKDSYLKKDVDLAAEIGVERGIFNHWLNGRRIPKVTEFIALCQVLHVEPSEVIRPGQQTVTANNGISALASRIGKLTPERIAKIEAFLADQEELSRLDKQQTETNKKMSA